MKKVYVFAVLAFAVGLFSCTSDIESAGLSSSSDELSSSSSVGLSSSSDEPFSSSSVGLSSSSDEPFSSSSVGLSSSSDEPFSSSSVSLSSSSDVPSSSSSVSLSSSSDVPPSSSSVGLSSSSYGDLCAGFVDVERFCDERDGEKYRTVKIGGQTWMAENLNYETSVSECYKNNPINCDTYGRLYDWSTAMRACPSGWHLPSNADWDELLLYVDGQNDGYGEICSGGYCSNTAGKYLRATSGWNKCGPPDSDKYFWDCEDTYDFSALPGGSFSNVTSPVQPPGVHFQDVGDRGQWWSSNESNASIAYEYIMYTDHTWVTLRNQNKSHLISVRCVKD